MFKRLVILLVVIFLSGAFIPAAAAVTKKARIVEEGFVLAGDEGRLIAFDVNVPVAGWKNGGWSFAFDKELVGNEGAISASKAITLLPSAALEQTVEGIREHPALSYRLWGRVTRYRGENFIFGSYFLPVIGTKKNETKPKEGEISINEPNDPLAIPDEVIAQLETGKIVRSRPAQKPLELKTDFILADKIGLLVKKPEGSFAFVPDSVGRSTNKQVSFLLLPCWSLERAWLKQSMEADPVRFKVAGIVTKYKGQSYLLLQRATRLYSHGNFSR